MLLAWAMKSLKVYKINLATPTTLMLCGLLIVTLANEQLPLVTSPFPEFLRSRFNPRMLQTNESRPKLMLLVHSGEVFEPLFQPKTTENVTTENVTTHRVANANTAAPVNNSHNSTTAATIAGSTEEKTVTPRSALSGAGVSQSLLDNSDCGIEGGVGDHYPWIAVLEHGNPDLPSSRKRTLSKGVLIDRKYVLTTVSSVQNSYPSWLLTGVRLGDAPTHRGIASFPSGRRSPAGHSTLLRLPIGMVFLHESKDIALIRLADGGVREFNDHIRPVCVPREDHRLEAFELVSHVCEKRHASSGTRQGSHSKLQPVELVASERCNQLLEPYGARLAVKSFCAWEDATDNCTGPLGGPVVAKIRGKYQVVGLRSYLQTETEVDGSELPSIYIRIGGFRKWIAAVIKAIHD